MKLTSAIALCNQRDSLSYFLEARAPSGKTTSTYIVNMKDFDKWYPKFDWKVMDHAANEFFGKKPTPAMRSQVAPKEAFAFYNTWRSNPLNKSRIETAMAKKDAMQMKKHPGKILGYLQAPCAEVIAFYPLCGDKENDLIALQYEDGSTHTSNFAWMTEPYPQMDTKNASTIRERLGRGQLPSFFSRFVEEKQKQPKRKRPEPETKEEESCPTVGQTHLEIPKSSKVPKLEFPPQSSETRDEERKHREEMQELQKQERDAEKAAILLRMQTHQAALKAAQRAQEQQQQLPQSSTLPPPSFLTQEEPETPLPLPQQKPQAPAHQLPPPPPPQAQSRSSSQSTEAKVPPVKISGRFFNAMHVLPNQYAAWFQKFSPEELNDITDDGNFNAARAMKKGFTQAYETAFASQFV